MNFNLKFKFAQFERIKKKLIFLAILINLTKACKFEISNWRTGTFREPKTPMKI